MDGRDQARGAAKKIRTVCVTGSTGYIGSWLVRSLLRQGYTVHATARDPGKVTSLVSSWEEGSNEGCLKVFQADLNEDGSFDEAVKGCIGVFHVAASMEFHVSSYEADIEAHVQTKILDPAIRGTLSILRACQRSGTVKRVVFTSSISTITAKYDDGKRRQVVNESSTATTEVVWNTKPSGWVYVLSKLMSEEAAFRFAKENSIDLVSVIPPTVAGPFLTSQVPASVQVLLSPVTGDVKLYPILLAVHERLGSISVVHIEDICNAHIFLLEQEAADGRYICSTGSCVLPQLADMLALEYPSFNPKRLAGDFHNSIPPYISSEKLTSLGFKFKYEIKDIIQQTVASSIQQGFLKISVS